VASVAEHHMIAAAIAAGDSEAAGAAMYEHLTALIEMLKAYSLQAGRESAQSLRRASDQASSIGPFDSSNSVGNPIDIIVAPRVTSESSRHPARAEQPARQ
jgi:hypothetical protein